MTVDQTGPGGSSAAENPALPPEAASEAWHDILDRSDAGAKPAPKGPEGSVPVAMFLVKGLRAHQAEVDLFIKGYLEFEEVQRICLKGRNYCEQGNATDPDYRQRLRREAYEDLRDAYERRPERLDRALLVDLEAQLEELRETISGKDSPFFRAGADLATFARGQLSRQLSNVGEAIAKVLGICQRNALRALDGLNGHVESIFNSTEAAKEAAAASMRDAYEGSSQDRQRAPISGKPRFGAQNANKPVEITPDPFGRSPK